MAKELEPLPAGTVQYVSDDGHLMTWVNEAARLHQVPLWILQRKASLYGEPIHRQPRDVYDPQCVAGIGRRLFIRDSQCPQLKNFVRHLEQTKQAAATARATGLIPVREFAKLVGRAKNLVTSWVHNYCPHMPHGWKFDPAPQWIPTLKGANPEVLWLPRATAREIKAAMDAEGSYKCLHRPDGRYIHSSEAAKRCNCTYTALAKWHLGDPVPGDGKLRRTNEDGYSRGDWFYHEKDIDDIAKAGKRPNRSPAPDYRKSKDGKRLVHTRIAVKLMGISEGFFRHLIKGRSPIPGNLPLTPFPFVHMGTPCLYWDEKQVLDVANAFTDLRGNFEDATATKSVAPWPASANPAAYVPVVIAGQLCPLETKPHNGEPWPVAMKNAPAAGPARQQPDDYFPADHYDGKFGIKANTLRKAQEAGNVVGEMRGGRWYYSLASVRRYRPDVFEGTDGPSPETGPKGKERDERGKPSIFNGKRVIS